MTDFFTSHLWAQNIAAIIGVFVAAFIANYLVRAILLKLLHRMLQNTSFGRDEELQEHGVINRLAKIVPALIISSGIAAIPDLPEGLVTVIRNVAIAFIIFVLASTVSGVLGMFDTLYTRREEAKDRPLKGYFQVAKLAVYIIASVLVIATLMDRSPVILLSGLGAMAAVLILVFQDTLLSLVASMQIASSNMVRVGDWIEMKHLDANGDVIEIALYTVKVQNFDKTITTIPIRKLITEPMKNYRGMQRSGGRRIKRALFIDQATIGFLTEEELRKLSSLTPLKDYLSAKEKEIADWNAKLNDAGHNPVNRRRITNIGTFRAYIEAYLRNHPSVHQGMTLLVRQMDPTPEGLPLELYCFTNTTVWAPYEQAQSDIFDHLYAVMPEFGLAPFQNPSGQDFRQALGGNETSLSKNKPI